MFRRQSNSKGMRLGRVVKPMASLLSITGALVLLAALIVLSTNPAEESLRRVDNQLRFMTEAANVVDEFIQMSLQRQTDVSEPLSAASGQLIAIGHEQLSLLKQTELDGGFLNHIRPPLIGLFNSLERDAVELSSLSALIERSTQLEQLSREVGREAEQFAKLNNRFVEATESFRRDGQNLVRRLREGGRAEQADSLYAGSLEISRLVTGDTAELQRAGDILNELRGNQAQFATSELASMQEITRVGMEMLVARRQLNQMAAEFPTSRLIEIAASLRERTNSDLLLVLATVNDARVLLNIYTVMLLAVLGYLAIRLRASFRALNRSHDDLELRVQERTVDLEQALTNLKDSQVQLVQAEKMSSLGQLVAGVMHEINTPLLFVQSNTEIMSESVAEMRDYVAATMPVVTAESAEQGKAAVQQLLAKRDSLDTDQVSEAVEEMATLASDSVEGLQQISELVQSLKDFSRLDRAAEDLFDVREGLEKTLTITRNLLKYGVNVEKDLVEVPEIPCSPSRLNQVFINLVTNAVQAMDGEGTLRLSTRALDNWVEVSVEDTGCGIPEEHLSKIMDPFFTTKPVGQGTGLGLSIVRQIVDEHEGQVLIDSKEGTGTRITLGFPIDRELARAEKAALGADNSSTNSDEEAAA